MCSATVSPNQASINDIVSGYSRLPFNSMSKGRVQHALNIHSEQHTKHATLGETDGPKSTMAQTQLADDIQGHKLQYSNSLASIETLSFAEQREERRVK